MSGALTRTQLQDFEQRIAALLRQLQEEEQELLAGTLDSGASLLEEGEEGPELPGDLVTQIAACREALVRIEAGQYGYCDCCGEVIELNHLMADPSVCRCVRCRRQMQSRLVSGL